MSETFEQRRAKLREQFLRAMNFAGHQAQAVIERYPDYTPMYTVGGKWRQESEAWTHWCEGFYPGIFWLLHKHTGEPQWRAWAEQYTVRLEPRQHDRQVHDLGFLFLSTYLRWYRLTLEPSLRAVLIEAGRTLALRQQKGGYLASFLGPHSLFIDIMMNVGLILWAANATDDDNLRQIGLEHSRVTARYLIAADGRAAHEGIFDPQTGQFLRESTQQGYAPGSAWTRGLAWAIYGFTAVHRLSGQIEFLQVAQRCADYYLQRAAACSPGLVPWWDFDIPETGPRLWDSSAAAITASGLLDLAEATTDPARAERYRDAALTILQTLSAPPFLACDTPGAEGILLHAVYHFHKQLGVDESVAWGDHYFVEALVKVLAGESEAGW
jgi:unsaturated chondroitin disaccharide hydrolase